MELTCPLCDSKNEVEESRVAGPELTCAVCGSTLKLPRQTGAPVRQASKYDGYNVGRRVLWLAPVWLLLSLAGFVLVLLFFNWMSPFVKRSGAQEEFRNEAMNQTPAGQPERDARREAQKPAPHGGTPSPAAAPALEPAAEGMETTPAPQGASVEENAEEFAVQTGSFDDRSQANEQVSHLRASGFESRVVEKQKEKTEGVWYQVRCGHFPTREEAAQLAAQLRAKRLADVAVIIEPTRQ